MREHSSGERNPDAAGLALPVTRRRPRGRRAPRRHGATSRRRSPATSGAGAGSSPRPPAHLIDAGGKRFRPLLVLLAAESGDTADADDVITRGRASSSSPTSRSLYHDDVMDEADLRRGADSANARWDNHVAILTGDFLFSQSSELTADLGPDAVRIQAQTFTRLVEGQILETVQPGAGRGPARALPRGGRRQDRLADRHLRALRRPLRRREPRGRGGADGVRRDRRLGLPALRRHPRHRLRVRGVGQDARAPTCARASRRCRS